MSASIFCAVRLSLFIYRINAFFFFHFSPSPFRYLYLLLQDCFKSRSEMKGMLRGGQIGDVFEVLRQFTVCTSLTIFSFPIFSYLSLTCPCIFMQLIISSERNYNSWIHLGSIFSDHLYLINLSIDLEKPPWKIWND